MKRSLVAVALPLLIAAAACINTHECPQPAFRGFGAGALGDPCESVANCGHGLSCRDIYVVPGFPDPLFTSNACTTDCASGCPAHAVCGNLSATQPDGGVDTVSACIPTCSVDADCFTGITAGACDAGACYRLQCKVDGDCPGHYTCESPGALCCDKDDTCDYSGPLPGYCRKPDDGGM